jgi:5'-3' exonuclease
VCVWSILPFGTHKSDSMGIAKFLSPVLEASGRIVDLVDYADQTLRIAIDISTWIYRECQANGELLADERHLSNYGRAQLLMQQQHNEGSSQERTNVVEDEETNVAGSDANAESMHFDEPSFPADGGVHEFVARCCTNVVAKIEGMQRATCCEILVVLDGNTPPVKSATVAERARKRNEQQLQRDLPVDPTANSPGLERRIQANRRTGAGIHYHAVVEAIVESLRSHKIPFLVAPYEADGQLAFLQRKGLVDLVVTDDSDLIAYGLETPVLYKIIANKDGAFTRGVLIRQADLAASLPGVTPDFDFLDFSPLMMACLFVATGCDYCDSLRGVGIKGAWTDVRATFLPTSATNVDIPPLKRLLLLLFSRCWDKASSKEKDAYARTFLAGLFMFRHCIVYDPIQRCCRNLLLDEEADAELMSNEMYAELARDDQLREEIVGRIIPPLIATHVAEGWICAKRLRPKSDIYIPDHVMTDWEQYLSGHPKASDMENEVAQTPVPVSTGDNAAGKTQSKGKVNTEKWDDCDDNMGIANVEQHELSPQRRSSPRPSTDYDENCIDYENAHITPSLPFFADYDIHPFRITNEMAEIVHRRWVSRSESTSSYEGRKKYAPQVGDTVVYIPRAHHETISMFPLCCEAPWQLWPDNAVWSVVQCRVQNVRYRFPYIDGDHNGLCR